VIKKYKHKIILNEFANDLKHQGYFAVDPHCHTSFSYDVPDVKQTSPEMLVKKQESLGLMPLISDHDTLNGYNYLMSRKKQKVIPAAEITIIPKTANLISFKKPLHALHINVFQLDNEQLAILEDLASKQDLDEFIRFLRQEDLDYMYNHPFWCETNEKLNWRAIPGLVKNYFDVIELNAGRPKNLNDLTLYIAEQFNKGIASASDTHTNDPGNAYTLAEGKNFRDFWQNVKESRFYVVREDMTPFTIMRQSGAMISNIFRANINAHKERSFTPASGVRALDILFKSVTSGSLKDKLFIKKTMNMMLQSVNYTAGPVLFWKLYLSKEISYGENVKEKIVKLTSSLKAFDNKINSKIHLNKNNYKKYPSMVEHIKN